MVRVYEVGNIPQDYQMTIYEHTTNGFLGLKYLLIPSSKRATSEMYSLIGNMSFRTTKVIPFKDLEALLVYQ